MRAQRHRQFHLQVKWHRRQRSRHHTVNAINDAPAATVNLSNHAPKTNAILTATATVTDVDGGPITLTYTWKVNGVAKQTHVTTALTDTFNLAVAGQGDRGDAITVEVTPYDGQVSGSTATDSATVLVAFVVTNTNNSGAGSLRQAILDANATPNDSTGPDDIRFAIPGAGVKTIAPTSALPNITEAVVIDGYTQAGSSTNTLAVGSNAALLIELNGAGAGSANGLTITGANSTVRGLVINRFSGSGILLSGASAPVSSSPAIISGPRNGAAALGNGLRGVMISNGASSIGLAPTALDDAPNETSSRPTRAGCFLTLASSFNIAGNYIGTDRGTIARQRPRRLHRSSSKSTGLGRMGTVWRTPREGNVRFPPTARCRY